MDKKAALASRPEDDSDQSARLRDEARMIEEAWVDAANGDTVSHAAFTAWLAGGPPPLSGR